MYIGVNVDRDTLLYTIYDNVKGRIHNCGIVLKRAVNESLVISSKAIIVPTHLLCYR